MAMAMVMMMMMMEKKTENNNYNQKKKKKQEWDNSPASLQQLQAKDRLRHMATIRRERALAYAFSEQVRRCVGSTSENVGAFDDARRSRPMDQDNGSCHWGWRWLERWMAAKPWETSFPGISRQHASVLVNVIDRDMEPHLVSSMASKPAMATATPSFVRKRTSLSTLESVLDDYMDKEYGGIGSKRVKSMNYGSSPAERPSYMQSTESTKAKEVKGSVQSVQQQRRRRQQQCRNNRLQMRKEYDIDDNTSNSNVGTIACKLEKNLTLAYSRTRDVASECN